MKFPLKISPEWPLRVGLAATYLYSGWDILLHPTSWTRFVPGWFTDLVTPFMPLETYLRLQAGIELILAIALLLWFLKPSLLKYVALLGGIEMAGILFLGSSGIDLITFRDLGLLGGFATLFLLFHKQSKDVPSLITQ